MADHDNVMRWFIKLNFSIVNNLLAYHDGLAIPAWIDPWKSSSFSSSHFDDLLDIHEILSFLAYYVDPDHISETEVMMATQSDVDIFHAIFLDKASFMYKKVVFEVHEVGIIVSSTTGKTREKAVTNYLSNVEPGKFVSQLVTNIFGRVIQNRANEERNAARVIESAWLEHALRPNGVLAIRAKESFYQAQNSL